MATIDAQQRHPITVYSGFRPFIGSGIPVRTWSFAQRLVRYDPTGYEADQEYDQPSFKTDTLVRRLSEEVMKLQLRDVMHQRGEPCQVSALDPDGARRSGSAVVATEMSMVCGISDLANADKTDSYHEVAAWRAARVLELLGPFLIPER